MIKQRTLAAKYSPTNLISFRKIAYFVSAVVVMHFVIDGMIDMKYVTDFYAWLREIVGVKKVKLWTMKNELMHYLPLLVASFLVVLRIEIKVK